MESHNIIMASPLAYKGSIWLCLQPCLESELWSQIKTCLYAVVHFYGRTVFFRNRMKWADDKLRSLQKNQLFLCIARSPAFTDFFNISTFEQFFQAAFYGGFAYVRAKCCNIGFFYNAEFLFKHSFDPFRF